MKKDKQQRKSIQNYFDTLVNKPEKRIKQFQKYLPKPDKNLMIIQRVTYDAKK